MLDLLFTNSPATVSIPMLMWVDNLPQIDHDSIVFNNLNMLPPKQEGIHGTLYNYKKADFDTYCNILCSVPWDLAKSDDINEW